MRAPNRPCSRHCLSRITSSPGVACGYEISRAPILATFSPVPTWTGTIALGILAELLPPNRPRCIWMSNSPVIGLTIRLLARTARCIRPARHDARADERGGLNMVQPGLGERLDKLDLVRGADRAGFDLEPFARAFLVDLNAFRQIGHGFGPR